MDENTIEYKDLARELDYIDYKSVRPTDLPYDHTGDCIILALAAALNLNYKFIYNELMKIATPDYLFINDCRHVVPKFLDRYKYNWDSEPHILFTNRKKSIKVGKLVSENRNNILIIGLKSIGASPGHCIVYKNNALYDKTYNVPKDVANAYNLNKIAAFYFINKVV